MLNSGRTGSKKSLFTSVWAVTLTLLNSSHSRVYYTHTLLLRVTAQLPLETHPSEMCTTEAFLFSVLICLLHWCVSMMFLAWLQHHTRLHTSERGWLDTSGDECILAEKIFSVQLPHSKKETRLYIYYSTQVANRKNCFSITSSRGRLLIKISETWLELKLQQIKYSELPHVNIQENENVSKMRLITKTKFNYTPIFLSFLQCYKS